MIIRLEPTITDEQLIKLYLHDRGDNIKRANPELFMECKNMVQHLRKDILMQMKNNLINPKLTYSNVG